MDVKIIVDGQTSEAGSATFDLDNACPVFQTHKSSDNFTCTSALPTQSASTLLGQAQLPSQTACAEAFTGEGTACKACPSFSTTPGPGTLTVDGCTECVEGYYGPFQSAGGQCTRCPINMIQSTKIEEQCVCDPNACLGGDYVTLANLGRLKGLLVQAVRGRLARRVQP